MNLLRASLWVFTNILVRKAVSPPTTVVTPPAMAFPAMKKPTPTQTITKPTKNAQSIQTNDTHARVRNWRRLSSALQFPWKDSRFAESEVAPGQFGMEKVHLGPFVLFLAFHPVL